MGAVKSNSRWSQLKIQMPDGLMLFFAYYWLMMSAASPQARMIHARPELAPNPAQPHQQKALPIQPALACPPQSPQL